MISFLKNGSSSGGSSDLNVFLQATEPATKNGIWLQDGNLSYDSIVADDNVVGSEEWDDKTYAVNPIDFSGGDMIFIENYIYIFYRTKAAKYDVLTDTYTLLSDIPFDFYNGSAENVATDIYLFGSGMNSYYRTAYKYDTVSNTYTQLADIPYDFYYSAISSAGTDIYLFGSADIHNRQLTYKYNTLTNTYIQLSNIPFGFYYGSCTRVGNDIYLFGSYGTGAASIKAYKYNILNASYTQLNDLPKSFSSGSITSVGTNIYIFYTDKTMYKYDILTNTYTQLIDSPLNASTQCTVNVNDEKIYFMYSKTLKSLNLYEKNYPNNSIVISQGTGYYKTKLINANTTGDLKYFFLNAWHYTTANGLNTTIPTYYGNGTQWVKFKN